jgi:sialidase-1
MRLPTFALLVTCATVGLPAGAQNADQLDVFTAGREGYRSYRIPAMVVTTKGTVLVFAEGRKNGAGDSGDIDLVLRRSEDGGRTFGPAQVVWDDGPSTCGNPAPVVDRRTGTVWLLMTHNPGDLREPELTTGQARGTRTVWVTHSEDDGRTWAKPREITTDVKRPEWTWYATGPGAGIQTAGGRLVVPCDHKRPGDVGYAHVIYSDDGGQTWRLGGSAGPNTNESRVVELSDGRLMLNMRNYGVKGAGKLGRAVATSADGGGTWSEVTHDVALIEPVCQASLIRGPGRATFLFANPASLKREKLTLRVSEDDCKTWPRAVVLHAGPAAYSDLAVLRDGTILCAYERGVKNAYEEITLARIRPDELKPVAR